MPRRSDDELLALVRQKAGALRHRRSLTALGTGTLVLLLLASGVALAGNSGPTKRTIRAVNAPTTSTEPAPDETTVPEISTTLAPTRTTTTTRPKPTSTTTVLTATPAGIKVDVIASPPYGVEGTAVSFTMRVTDGAGTLEAASIDYGDGGPTQIYDRQPDTAAGGCASEPPQAPPSDETLSIGTHQYNRAGRYTVRVTASTGDICNRTPYETGSASTIVQIMIPVDPQPTTTTSTPARVG